MTRQELRLPMPGLRVCWERKVAAESSLFNKSKNFVSQETSGEHLDSALPVKEL